MTMARKIEAAESRCYREREKRGVRGWGGWQPTGDTPQLGLQTWAEPTFLLGRKLATLFDLPEPQFPSSFKQQRDLLREFKWVLGYTLLRQVWLTAAAQEWETLHGRRLQSFHRAMGHSKEGWEEQQQLLHSFAKSLEQKGSHRRK